MAVGIEVARSLRVPFDVFLSSVSSASQVTPSWRWGPLLLAARVLSEELLRELAISDTVVDQVTARERLELERRDRLYRGDRSQSQC